MRRRQHQKQVWERAQLAGGWKAKQAAGASRHRSQSIERCITTTRRCRSVTAQRIATISIRRPALFLRSPPNLNREKQIHSSMKVSSVVWWEGTITGPPQKTTKTAEQELYFRWQIWWQILTQQACSCICLRFGYILAWHTYEWTDRWTDNSNR